MNLLRYGLISFMIQVQVAAIYSGRKVPKCLYISDRKFENKFSHIFRVIEFNWEPIVEYKDLRFLKN